MRLDLYIAKELGISTEELKRSLFNTARAINIIRRLLESGQIVMPYRPKTLKSAYNVIWHIKDKIRLEEIKWSG